VRAAGGQRRLALTPAQTAILDELFAVPSTVPAALARMLAQGGDAENPSRTRSPENPVPYQ